METNTAIGVGELLLAVVLAGAAVVFENQVGQFQLPALLIAIFAGLTGLRRLR